MPAFLAALLLAHAGDYAAQVKPLLAARCYACHGALQQKGGLRLDTVALMKKGGDTGPAVVPRDSTASLLVAHVIGKERRRMPPPAEGEHLKKEEIAVLVAWIDNGAVGPADEKPEADPRDHWAFRPPVRPPIPAGRGWGSNPIDAFLAAGHAKRGLKPRPEAGKRVLLRRVALGLTGLPPTTEEMAAFMADASPDAYGKAVRRLLASPAYGERWGRHWMDVWRYSDWWGLGAEVRNSQKHIWHWRDWIVESLNADAGYDAMVRDMLAADELNPTDDGKLRASGFLARSYFKFNRNTWLEDTVEHTSKAFLGLTLNCAKCHDHKYDPVAQEDFYRFRAFFEPYQIRTDLASDSDFEKDGVPRAFDCNLDAPTYLFVRGDEKNPRKKPIMPGLPAVLGARLAIRPVALPPEAHSPGARPAVLATHLRQAEEKIRGAREALALASKAPRQPERPTLTPKVVDAAKDDFARARPDLWESKNGKWSHKNGKLAQESGETLRSVLRLKKEVPVDFVARLKFTITGGKTYRSVGVCFDVAEGNEVLAYLSAYAGGPKLQVAYKRQGAEYVYPPAGTQPRAVRLGEAQEMVLRVRGQVVNVEVNGAHALAYALAVPRKSGAMEIVTYDAQAEFAAFELSPLPAEALLRSPAKATAPAPATLPLPVAEKALATALLRPDAIRKAAEADRLRTPEARRAASAAERALKLAEAEEAVARAEAEPGQKKLAAARAALAALHKKIDTNSEVYTPLRGSLKTLESNTESEASRSKPFPATSSGRRSALAKWITARDNPLAARVAVNHLWLRHFGTPLVATVFDFGRKGAAPTHPELLDWLAVELMDSGWSMKHMHTLIVTSNAYRMSSSSAGADAERVADPENKAYWRMNSVRMEAQAIRDSLLRLAGDLDQRMGGAPEPANAETGRRSLYFFHSHNEQNRFLEIFDDANVLECYRRSESVLPQQALALQNSRTASAAAERIAARIEAKSDAAFCRAAFEAVLCQEPTPAELAECVAALKGVNRSQLVHALLNHNDFVTIR